MLNIILCIYKKVTTKVIKREFYTSFSHYDLNFITEGLRYKLELMLLGFFSCHETSLKIYGKEILNKTKQNILKLQFLY